NGASAIETRRVLQHPALAFFLCAAGLPLHGGAGGAVADLVVVGPLGARAAWVRAALVAAHPEDVVLAGDDRGPGKGFERRQAAAVGVQSRVGARHPGALRRPAVPVPHHREKRTVSLSVHGLAPEALRPDRD